MNNISIIACVGKNLELGKNNDLIWHLPNDLKYFKNVTSGKTVIMGRRTFESLPGILPKRRNIMITSSKKEISGVEIFNNIESVLKEIKEEDEVFVIGGASIYKEFLKYANKIYLTEVNKTCPKAEVYFPKFDKRKYKKTIVGNNSDNGIEYSFVIYERR